MNGHQKEWPKRQLQVEHWGRAFGTAPRHSKHGDPGASFDTQSYDLKKLKGGNPNFESESSKMERNVEGNLKNDCDNQLAYNVSIFNML